MWLLHASLLNSLRLQAVVTVSSEGAGQTGHAEDRCINMQTGMSANSLSQPVVAVIVLEAQKIVLVRPVRYVRPRAPSGNERLWALSLSRAWLQDLFHWVRYTELAGAAGGDTETHKGPLAAPASPETGASTLWLHSGRRSDGADGLCSQWI